MLRSAVGGGRGQISLKKSVTKCTVQRNYHYEGEGGCQISRKKRYVTLEWPMSRPANIEKCKT